VHFSDEYTDYRISPLVGGAGSVMELTLHAALEIDWDRVGARLISSVLHGAMNRYAGGRRTFNDHEVDISWRIDLTVALAVRMGPTSDERLGVCAVPAEVIRHAGGHAAAMFISESRGPDRISRVFLPAERLLESTTTSRRRPEQRRAAAAREEIEAHAGRELGHGYDLDDDHSARESLMYYRLLTPAERRRLNQRWTDAELRAALVGLFPEGSRPRWLQ
jgi:hypothetical protein